MTFSSMSLKDHMHSAEVFLFAMGNLVFYIPLAMLTKMSALGFFSGVKVTGFEIIPLYTVGNVLANFLFLKSSRWIKLARHIKICGISLPVPRWYTFISGTCILGQIFTVIWIYAYTGISVVFAALLMKGSVFIISPFVDILVKKRRRKIYWPSWIAAGLSLTALVIASVDKLDISISIACVVDIILYLASYFSRIVFMSVRAKTTDRVERKQYVVEEQISAMFSLTALVFTMGAIGYFVPGSNSFHQIWRGMSTLPAQGFVMVPFFIGAAAMANGVFASLVHLDRRENTFCVSLVQSTSILAGMIATTLLYILYNEPPPTINKLIAIVIVLLAIGFLGYRGRVENLRGWFGNLTAFRRGRLDQ